MMMMMMMMVMMMMMMMMVMMMMMMMMMMMIVIISFCFKSINYHTTVLVHHGACSCQRQARFSTGFYWRG